MDQVEETKRWTRATNVIQKAIWAWSREEKLNVQPMSMSGYVAEELKKAGLLNEAGLEVTGFLG